MIGCEQFGFLSLLENLDAFDLRSAMANLVSIYKADLERCLGDELLQFAAIANLYRGDYNDNMPKEMLFDKVIVEKDLEGNGERSFSKMKIIKNRPRTTTNQDGLSWLAMLSIEDDLLRELDFQDEIKIFSSRRSCDPSLL